MKKITVIMAAIMMLAATVAFAGCGASEPKTLQDYMTDNEEARQEVEKAIDAKGSDIMDVDVAYEGNNIIINATLKETYPEDTLEAVSKTMESVAVESESTMRSVIAQIEESSGVSGVSMDVMIKNGDGKQLFSKHYTGQ